MDNRIYLSRRNLEVLLSKLNRRKIGESSACTIIKYKNESDPAEYQQTMNEVYVTAVENEDYYVKRDAGAMLPVDEPAVEVQATEIDPRTLLQAN